LAGGDPRKQVRHIKFIAGGNGLVNAGQAAAIHMLAKSTREQRVKRIHCERGKSDQCIFAMR
jgi:hypothetical protein